MRPEAILKAVGEVSSKMETESFKHQRRHNIYFRDEVPGLSANHPAMQKFDTVNHVVCGDQVGGSVVEKIYEYPALRRFLADTMKKKGLHLMGDPLARVNVMAIREGEALNWHFDQAEFTTTIMLQSPKSGGELEYCSELRTAENPNYEGVTRLVSGDRSDIITEKLIPGALNVFRGVNTPHRVTPVQGSRDRIMTIFSYYEQPDVTFTNEMRIGFYGRAD